MGNFDHLLSPVMVAGHLFKNRICMTPNAPQFIQGDEPYPVEAAMQHYWERARNGAALVTLSGLYEFAEDEPMPYPMRDYYRYFLKGENHYLAQLVEGLHGFGTYATIQERHMVPADHDVCLGATPFDASFFPGTPPKPYELSEAQLRQSTEDLVERCVTLKRAGLDGVFFHASYQFTPLGRMLSPVVNQRTDRYGGSFENRAQLLLETCEAVKAACGRGFIIELHITGEERDPNTGQTVPGGWTIQDSVRLAELVSGYVDILHLRGWNVDQQHPTWYQPPTPPYLYLAEACKAAKTETKILCTCNNMDPAAMEAVIAEGKADLLGMARSLVADPQFIQKLHEGRPEDIRPCLRCNRCFETGPDGTPRTSRCSINPMWGFESRRPILFAAPTRALRVAVAGGGPAGMESARVLHERGHKVVLFERTGRLGGQLNVADASARKWALRGYRDYLVGQMGKLGIEVRLNCELTPELLAEGDFDAVVAACGALPKRPDISGADRSNVFDVLQAYGNENALGQRVVVVGGGSTGIETGMHLAEDFGRQVTVLGRRPVMGYDLPPTHYRVPMQAAWEAMEGLTTVTSANVTAIDDAGVRYRDAEGAEHVVPCDSVVLACGMQPETEQVLAFARTGVRLIVVGDAQTPGNVMDLVRDAHFRCQQL